MNCRMKCTSRGGGEGEKQGGKHTQLGFGFIIIQLINILFTSTCLLCVFVPSCKTCVFVRVPASSVCHSVWCKSVPSVERASTLSVSVSAPCLSHGYEGGVSLFVACYSGRAFLIWIRSYWLGQTPWQQKHGFLHHIQMLPFTLTFKWTSAF